MIYLPGYKAVPAFATALLLALCCGTAAAQQPAPAADQLLGAWVHLAQRLPVPGWDACTALAPDALDRRQQAGWPADTSADWPVHPHYQQLVAAHSCQTLHTSRWLNALAVLATEAQLAELAQLPGVERVVAAPLYDEEGGMETADVKMPAPTTEDKKEKEDGNALVQQQTSLHQIALLQERGLTGKGVNIAVLDAGFRGANKAPELAHLFTKNQILHRRDFFTKKDEVFHDGEHGTAVLSCIAGRYRDQPMGLAPDAHFLLARTERDLGEPFREEVNWVAAAEWADSLGAHMLNSSLGYTKPRYRPADMTGATTYVSKGANEAAARGMLVVVSAGNEGGSKWTCIGAPADAPGVLTVGGVQPLSQVRIPFSSPGPNASGQLKPNVCASGKAWARGATGSMVYFGTSFAAPLVTGFAACARQLHPGATGPQLLALTEACGHLYPFYDYMHGYGIPQASRLFMTDSARSLSARRSYATFGLKPDGKRIYLAFADSLPPSQLRKIDERLPYGYLYYHIADTAGKLVNYGIKSFAKTEGTIISMEEGKGGWPEPTILRFFFLGHLREVEWRGGQFYRRE